MLRNLVLLLAGLSLYGPAPAQNPVQWSNNLDTAVGVARRTLRPILLWVPFESESHQSLLYLGQSRTLRDPMINELIRARFIPVRLSRSSNNID